MTSYAGKGINFSAGYVFTVFLELNHREQVKDAFLNMSLSHARVFVQEYCNQFFPPISQG